MLLKVIAYRISYRENLITKRLCRSVSTVQETII